MLKSTERKSLDDGKKKIQEKLLLTKVFFWQIWNLMPLNQCSIDSDINQKINKLDKNEKQ